MRGRKPAIGFTAMFAAMGIVVFAAPPTRERPHMSSEERAKLTRATVTLVVKYVARELSLGAEETEKFVKAYVAEREAGEKRLAEARQSGERRQTWSVYRENQKSLQAVLEANLSPDQVKKAEEILGFSMFPGGLESSVRALLRAEVAEKKMNKALPVLVKHHQQERDLFRKAFSTKEITREQFRTKREEMREATVEKLGDIVGEKAADAWKEGTAFRERAPRRRRQSDQ